MTLYAQLSVLALCLRFHQSLVGQQYSWTSSIFYIGYLAASYPISLGFVRFPLGKYLSVLMYDQLRFLRTPAIVLGSCHC
jgi:hypothetical protein